MMTEKPEPTPGQRWKDELSQAKKYLEPWHTSNEAILKRLKDLRPKTSEERRVNLFTAEVLTKRAVLYGKTPQSTVSRRWNDAGDDVARVAAEMLGRHLNDDAASGYDGYCRALGYALEDRLTVGMGLARVRYEVETEPIAPEPAESERETSEMDSPEETLELGQPDAPKEDGGGEAEEELREYEAPETDDATPASPLERKVYEAVPVDYVFWKDVLWSPCRYWEVVRWVAFRTELSRKALLKRFGTAGGSIPLDATSSKEPGKEREPEPPWGRATVWEIWDKEEKQVVWCTEGGVILDTRKDPYQLRGFFPCPRPLFSLITTDEMIPRPDFVLAEDLYNDLDTLSTRMHLLRTALRVVGVFDASNSELQDLVNNTSENRMIPVKNWALFGEKGGLSGTVDFFPVQDVAQALVALSAEYESLKMRLYEVTGMSDILRGQGSAVATTYGEQRIKAQFGSARLQAVQDEFARFASELQCLKAELISRQFDPENIIKASNMERTPDAPIAMNAALLIKSNSEAFRVKVQPEALALADFAAVKEERMEVVQAVAQFVSAVTPMIQFMPMAAPAMVEILKWLVSALRGSSEIEGVLDKALDMANQANAQAQQSQPQQPDPKVLAQQMKGQQDQQKRQEELQGELTKIQAKVQADAQREENQMRYNVQEAALKKMIGATGREQPATGPGGVTR